MISVQFMAIRSAEEIYWPMHVASKSKMINSNHLSWRMPSTSTYLRITFKHRHIDYPFPNFPKNMCDFPNFRKFQNRALYESLYERIKDCLKKDDEQTHSRWNQFGTSTSFPK